MERRWYQQQEKDFVRADLQRYGAQDRWLRLQASQEDRCDTRRTARLTYEQQKMREEATAAAETERIRVRRSVFAMATV